MFCRPGFIFFRQELSKSDLNYLEIGVFNGDSIAELAKLNPNKMIYGIDPFIEDGCTMHTTHVKENESMPVQRQNTYNNISGLSNIKLFEQKTSEFDNTQDLNIGWILIDGSHHYEDVCIDIKIAMKQIGNKKGGIVFDDTNYAPVIQAHNEFLIEYKDRITNTVDLYNGAIMAHFIN